VITIESQNIRHQYETINAILDRAMDGVGAEAGAIYLLDEEAGGLVTLSHRGLSGEYGRGVTQLEGIATSVVKSEEPILAKDTADSTASNQVAEKKGFRTLFGMPLRSGGRILGAISLASSSPDKFSQKTIRSLTAMEEVISIAIGKTRLTERLEEAFDGFNKLADRVILGGFDTTFDNRHLVQCWVEKGCSYTSCPCYGSENLRCWQVAGTFCDGDIRGKFAQKYDSCTQCEVYQKSCYRDELTRMGESFNNMIFLMRREIQKREEVRKKLLRKLISAQEEERSRIARELHDEASQDLAALALNLEAGADALPDKYRNVAEKLRLIKAQLVYTLDGIRSLALGLRPSALDDLGLSMATEWYVKDFLVKRGLDVKVDFIKHKTKLPSYTATMLFRIIQEALTNIVKHAKATEVKVRLETSESKATLVVEDNGKGFDVSSALGQEGERQSLGLHGMAERASLLGGTFNIDSGIGQGTRLHVEVPIVPTAGEVASNEKDQGITSR
jgi:signal transduction histidine kinase